MNERRRVIRCTNDYRASQGLPALRRSRGLMLSAQNTARREARSGVLHHFPGWWRVIDRYNQHVFARVEENIADGQNTARAVVDAWINSPEHRANMLGAVTHIGVGRVKDGAGRIWWTQHFGGAA